MSGMRQNTIIKLENYVGPVPTYCAVVRLIFDHLSFKLADLGNVHNNLGFSTLFHCRVSSLYVTDGRTGKTHNAACYDGRMEL